eukprot:6482572-Pyramimonas_sp.AAC.2
MADPPKEVKGDAAAAEQAQTDSKPKQTPKRLKREAKATTPSSRLFSVGSFGHFLGRGLRYGAILAVLAAVAVGLAMQTTVGSTAINGVLMRFVRDLSRLKTHHVGHFPRPSPTNQLSYN